MRGEEVGEHGLVAPSSAEASHSRREPAKRVWRLHPARAEEIDRRPARRGTAARSCPPSGWRTSTSSTPPGSSPEKCTTIGIAVGQPAVDRGGHGRRRVDHHEVAGGEELAELR